METVITPDDARKELKRRKLPKTDKRRNLWRSAAIKRGVFDLSRKQLQALAS